MKPPTDADYTQMLAVAYNRVKRIGIPVDSYHLAVVAGFSVYDREATDRAHRFLRDMAACDDCQMHYDEARSCEVGW